MKALTASALVAFATYMWRIEELKFPSTFLRLRIKKFNFRFKKPNIDQEFLTFLWEFKSELSSGSLISQNSMQIPEHKLKAYFQTILSLAQKTGAPVTPIVNRLIKQTKNTIELDQEIAAELASTKATLIVLACLPLVGLALSTLLNGNSLHWLFGTKYGHLCLAVGISLNLVGIYWLKAIIRRALLDQ